MNSLHYAYSITFHAVYVPFLKYLHAPKLWNLTKKNQNIFSCKNTSIKFNNTKLKNHFIPLQYAFVYTHKIFIWCINILSYFKNAIPKLLAGEHEFSLYYYIHEMQTSIICTFCTCGICLLNECSYIIWCSFCLFFQNS